LNIAANPQIAVVVRRVEAPSTGQSRSQVRLRGVARYSQREAEGSAPHTQSGHEPKRQADMDLAEPPREAPHDTKLLPVEYSLGPSSSAKESVIPTQLDDEVGERALRNDVCRSIIEPVASLVRLCKSPGTGNEFWSRRCPLRTRGGRDTVRSTRSRTQV
jgi:hypothetical protein